MYFEADDDFKIGIYRCTCSCCHAQVRLTLYLYRVLYGVITRLEVSSSLWLVYSFPSFKSISSSAIRYPQGPCFSPKFPRVSRFFSQLAV